MRRKVDDAILAEVSALNCSLCGGAAEANVARWRAECLGDRPEFIGCLGEEGEALREGIEIGAAQALACAGWRAPGE